MSEWPPKRIPSPEKTPPRKETAGEEYSVPTIRSNDLPESNFSTTESIKAIGFSGEPEEVLGSDYGRMIDATFETVEEGKESSSSRNDRKTITDKRPKSLTKRVSTTEKKAALVRSEPKPTLHEQIARGHMEGLRDLEPAMRERLAEDVLRETEEAYVRGLMTELEQVAAAHEEPLVLTERVPETATTEEVLESSSAPSTPTSSTTSGLGEAHSTPHKHKRSFWGTAGNIFGHVFRGFFALVLSGAWNFFGGIIGNFLKNFDLGGGGSKKSSSKPASSHAGGHWF